MLTILLDADPVIRAELAIAWLGAPGGDPLQPDTLVVGDPGTGFWLQHRLAARAGVSANLRIERPAGFLWRELADQLPGTHPRPPFDPLRVRWAIYAAMEQAPDLPELALPRRRWAEATDTERLRFALRLATLFDRYQGWRREWTELWARGHGVDPGLAEAVREHEPWQRWLWREVLARIEGYSREHPFDRLKREAGRRPAAGGAAGQGDLFDAPAGRVLLYGPLGLSPDQLEALARLGQRRDMLWLAVDPSVGFWQDLVSPVQAARWADGDPRRHALFDTRPAVLGQWGREYRDALACFSLLEQGGLAVVSDEALRERPLPPAAEAPVNRLRLLQRAILSLDDGGWADPAALRSRRASGEDWSIEIHCLHGPGRQADVVLDRLLAAFDAIDDLRADEVVVFCVDVESAAPELRARFGADPDGRLPIAVAGHPARDEPAVDAVQGFLAMVLGEVTPRAVVEWLDAQWARRRFGLDDDALAGLRELVDAAGWVTDDLDAPAASERGWLAALSRVATGACHDPDEIDPPSCATVVGASWPVPCADDAVLEALGLAAALVAEARWWRAHESPAPVHRWVAALERFCSAWFGRGLAVEGVARLRRAGAELLEQSAAGKVAHLTLEAFVEGLAVPLDDDSRVAWPQGAITIAPLGAFRGVPFRVAAVMGLDDGAWPPLPPRAEYDLIRAVPRFGDPSAADSARARFLDLVRDTGERLIITYAGRDARDDSTRPPASVVGELTDYLRAVDPLWPDVACRFEHPLQPFSPRRFGGPAGSYDGAWHPAARVLGGEGRFPVIGPLRLEPEGSAGPVARVPDTMDAFVRAILRPQRDILARWFGARLPWIDAASRAYEAFEPGELAPGLHRLMVDIGVAALGAGWGEARILRAMSCHPRVPPGIAFPRAGRQWMLDARRLAEARAELLAAAGVDPSAPPEPPRPVRLRLGGGRVLVGALPPVWHAAAGDVAVSVAGTAPGLDQIVERWCRYLFWAAAGDDGRPPSLLVPAGAGDGVAVLGWGPVADAIRGAGQGASVVASSLARTALDELLVRLGSRPEEATAAFVRIAQRWFERTDDPDAVADQVPGVVHAQHAWTGEGSAHGTGLRDRPETQMLWRGEPPPFERVLRESVARYAPIGFAGRGSLTAEAALRRWLLAHAERT